MQAGIAEDGGELIARVEAPGRVVLEDPLALLRVVQSTMAQEMSDHDDTSDLAQELIAQRQRDASLE